MEVIVMLVERDAEFSALESAVAHARSGGTSAVMVEGPAGIGKSALLTTLAGHGHAHGWTVLQARCCPWEGNVAFGAVRQLFELALGAPEAGAGAGSDPDAEEILGPCADTSTVPVAAFHDLYRSVRRLAKRTPLLLLLVDDAHHADLPSRQWLTYLACRLHGSGVCLVISVRTGESAPDDPLTAELAAHPECLSLGPLPLSPSGVALWLKEATGDEPTAEAAALCHQATGGNPALVRALGDDLARSGLPPLGAGRPDTAALIGRTLLERLPRLLGRHSPAVGTAATALAVLDSGSSTTLLARAAGLDSMAVAQSVTVLERAGLLITGPPWRFSHPLLTETLLAQAGNRSADAIRVRAAQAALDCGDNVALGADLLLATTPCGEAWRVDAFREAARQALDRLDPATARTYLHRALDEPPAETQQAAVLGQLGIAEVHSDPAGAIRHLRAAMDRQPGVAERVRLAPHLAEALVRTGRADDAVTLLDALAADIPAADRESLYQLWAQGLNLLLEEAPRLADAWIGHGSISHDLPGHTPAQRLLLAALALKTTLTGRSAAAAATLAQRALGRVHAPGEPALTSAFAIVALLHADRLTEATHRCDAWMGMALDRQPPPLRTLFLSLRALLARRTGQPGTAIVHARDAMENAHGAVEPHAHGRRYEPFAQSQLVRALLDLGEHDKAVAVCLRSFDRPVEQHWSWTTLLAARARLRLVQGQDKAALDDLEECGSRQLAAGYDNPALVPWRSEAALVRHRLGDLDGADRLAREELELARRWGSPCTVATSLRAMGLLRSGSAAVDALREAAELLEPTPATLDLATVLTDLGERLHESGRVDEARDSLRRALDLAAAAEARPLAARAHRTLRATGARPRRPRQSGVPALTDRERHVASLAAAGMTNDMIATELFITRRTVEFHLTRAYRKLGVTSRTELTAGDLPLPTQRTPREAQTDRAVDPMASRAPHAAGHGDRHLPGHVSNRPDGDWSENRR
ncbi:AAA family ATPase [Streptomyces violascens]|uniref:helix-turn-helix transcriptional regulator n=1 Tax=Streptomyces violascens TaxID=67381 RepID=UPI0037BBD8EF